MPRARPEPQARHRARHRERHSAPSSGRTSFGGKSPLTDTIKESNSGGLSAQHLARLGLRAIVIEGGPRSDYWIVRLTKDGAWFLPATDLVGKGMYAVCRTLWERHGTGVAIVGIGPAGEHRMAGAGICVNDRENTAGRYAGRGGMGAVMGSKGLKAIVIDDTEAPGVAIADPARFKTATETLAEASLSHDVTKKGGALHTFGTNVLASVLNEAGGFPTHNFRSGRFALTAQIGGEALRDVINKRNHAGKTGHGCHPGCIIQCSNVFPDPDGKFRTASLEYESVWALGANCGIGNLDDIADLVWICNDVGVDTIEMGAAIAVAMDGGLLRFGDADGAKRLLEDAVRHATPLGRIIGNGAELTGKAFGVVRVPTVKGQAMPAYEPRAVKGMGVTYATATMGADHTAGYTTATEILGVGGKADPLSAEGKADLSRAFQASTAFIDSSGYCLQRVPGARHPRRDGRARRLVRRGGRHILDVEDAMKLGADVLKVERRFNEAAGFTRAHDRLPEFMTYEPLPPHQKVFDVPDAELDRVHAD